MVLKQAPFHLLMILHISKLDQFSRKGLMPVSPGVSYMSAAGWMIIWSGEGGVWEALAGMAYPYLCGYLPLQVSRQSRSGKSF